MSSDASEASRAVAVLGGGVLGVGWAIVFARAGLTVRLFEQDADRRSRIPSDLNARLTDLSHHGLLAVSPSEIASRVVIEGSLDAAVDGAEHVQEAVSEDLGVKLELFGRLDRMVPVEVPIASSTSAMTASMIAGNLETRSRCLVAHPGNPPYLLPVVEVAPSADTDPDVVGAVVDLMESCHMAPVVVKREIEGLVFNRLQGAILREAYCLVRDGVISAADLDRVVTNGPGRRWAVIGPFMTANLNVRGGLVAHAARMGAAYQRMGAERGDRAVWTDDLVSSAAVSLHEVFPLDEWDAQARERDLALMRIAAALKSEANARDDLGPHLCA